MPGYTIDTATTEHHGPVTDSHAETHGYTLNFVSFAVDVDATPLMDGLPEGRCQCPHWGYVQEGRMTFRFADRDEVFGPGTAFYVPAGHVPIAEAGTTIVQFSPSAELAETSRVLVANTAKMMGAGQRPG